MNETEIKQKSDDLREIYKQDCEFIRYRDGLRWSRFQTVSFVESGALYMAFSKELANNSDKFCLILLATMLTAFLFVIAIADESGVDAHLDRVRNFEGGKGITFQREKKFEKLGTKTTKFFMLFITIVNISVAWVVYKTI